MDPSALGDSALRSTERVVHRPLVNTIQTVRSPIWSVPSVSEGQLSMRQTISSELPPVGLMVTVGSDVPEHRSPQILLTQHSLIQPTPRMVVAKPLIHSHPHRPIRQKPASPSLAQLAGQLPKLTPQMILASMKSLQVQHSQKIGGLQQTHVASVAGGVSIPMSEGVIDTGSSKVIHHGHNLIPKTVRHSTVQRSSSLGIDHARVGVSQRVIAPLAIPPPAAPLMQSVPVDGESSIIQSSGQRTTITTSKPRKPCNCKNSQCLKLYCDCFANGEFCREACNCHNCKNNIGFGEDRAKAIKVCLDRNPNAFKPKVGQNRSGDERRHIKGCNCKRSGCLKNYCECYEAKIPCSNNCRCVGCKNVVDRADSKALMHLADAADIRTQQQHSLSTQFVEQLEMTTARPLPTRTTDGQRLPFSFVNEEVAKATCLCLLEESSHASMNGKSYIEAERDVLLEFGRCLSQIIHSTQTANEDESQRTTQVY